MRRTKRSTLKELVGIVRSRRWREIILSALASWNRHQVVQIIGAVALAWLIGAAALHAAERGVNDSYATWSDSLWGVGLLLFSGMEQPPQTSIGRVIALVLLIFGVGTAGLFTASLASLLIERYLRRRDVSNFEMEGHLVLCNWAPRGLEWIREVHAKIIQDKRPVVK